ncbi:MAG: universal stress protein [Anaerolineae bacterium]|nr:universal stress protein [Anaerolineae bacterium]
MENSGRYKKIVVPIDGSGWSERAIPHAVEIARNNAGAEIILLHVFRPPAYEYTDQLALAGQEAQLQEVREQIKKYLMGLRGQLRSEGMECRVQFIEGTGVAALICDYINQEGVDLVVLSSHGRSGLMRFIFGSIAERILQGVNVPVLIIRPGRDE